MSGEFQGIVVIVALLLIGLSLLKWYRDNQPAISKKLSPDVAPVETSVTQDDLANNPAIAFQYLQFIRKTLVELKVDNDHINQIMRPFGGLLLGVPSNVITPTVITASSPKEIIK